MGFVIDVKLDLGLESASDLTSHRSILSPRSLPVSTAMLLGFLEDRVFFDEDLRRACLNRQIYRLTSASKRASPQTEPTDAPMIVPLPMPLSTLRLY